jgi:hypothetical protein
MCVGDEKKKKEAQPVAVTNTTDARRRHVKLLPDCWPPFSARARYERGRLDT